MKFHFVLVLLFSSLVVAGCAVAAEPYQYVLNKEKVRCAKFLEGVDKTTVQFFLTDEETARFADLTERHIGQKLQVVYKDRVLVNAVVRGRIESGSISTTELEVEEGLTIIRELNCDMGCSQKETSSN